MTTNRHHVFVYGTLLSGEGNHRLLEGPGASYMCDASTRTGEWRMANLGAYPGVMPGGSDVIDGELYEVDDATLARLDRLEGHPTFYKRCRAQFNCWDGDASHVEAWIYLLPRKRRYLAARRIPGGSWKDREGIDLDRMLQESER